MTPGCGQCGAPLRRFKFFRQACVQCGARHKAARGVSLLGGILGALASFMLIAGFFLPGPLWVPLLLVPALLVVAGIVAGLLSQRWIRIPE